MKELQKFKAAVPSQSTRELVQKFTLPAKVQRFKFMLFIRFTNQKCIRFTRKFIQFTNQPFINHFVSFDS